MGKSDLIEDETSLAYRLSNLRKDHDLSQKQLADQLHVTHSQISRIESGETKNPNISIVIDVARFFHVSTDYLLGITQITSPKSYDISGHSCSKAGKKHGYHCHENSVQKPADSCRNYRACKGFASKRNSDFP